MGHMHTTKAEPVSRYCFVSYSTREPHVNVLIECLRIVFTPHFEVKLTPSALLSGASQRDQITKLIDSCSFAIVALDGLRPNVIFEYGIIHGENKPAMLFVESEAEVDIRGFFRDPPSLGVGSVRVDLDTQFSDVKDVHYRTWRRFEIASTARAVWEEYGKKNYEMQDFIEIPEPRL
jgi:hypothetical protein